MASKKKGGTSKGRSKSKTANNKAANRAKKSQGPAKASRLDDMDFVRDICLFIVCGLAVLLFLCNFGICGTVGNMISGFLFGVFGLPNFIFPFIFVGSVFFLISNYENRIAVIKCIAVYLIYLLISTFFGIVTYGKIGEDGLDAVKCYLYGFANHSGGGFFGGILTGLLVGAFGKVGAYLLVILALAVLTFLLLERTPVQAILSGGRKAETRMRQRMSERTVGRDKDDWDDDDYDEDNQDGRSKVQSLSSIDRNRRRNASPEQITLPESRRDEITRDQKEAPRTARTKNKVSGITDTDLTPIDQRVTIHRATDEMTEIQGQPLPPEASMAISRKPAAPAQEKTSSLNDPITAVPAYEGTLAQDRRRNGTKKAIHPISQSAEEATIEEAIISAQSVKQASESDAEERIAAKAMSQKEMAVGETESAPVKQEKPVSAIKQTQMENTAGQEGVVQVEKEIAAAQSAKKPSKAKRYLPPSIDLLKLPKNTVKDSQESLYQTAQKLEKTLSNFGIEAQVVDISQGPSVTRYEIQPAVGVKVARIVNLSDDLKLNLAATDIRIEAPVPGKSVVGIEIPNKNAVTVSFRELIDSPDFKASKSTVSFAAGRDLTGRIIISDIDKMPHVLIAGATGSGKSVCINTIIMSILYHTGPDEVKFIMVDPKIVELSVYNGIPHLLIPVVTDPKKAAGALMWAVKEMTDRYQKFADAGVRKIDDYNAKIVNGYIKQTVNGTVIEKEVTKMPRIVVIVDELADLMMVASSEVEDAITRLTQLARAAGIHLIIATQRPSADVITGVIKSNMPSRIAFAVTSAINSRIILDTSGAEKLLGKGDMLYYPQGYSQPLRVQGAFVSDDEISKVCDYLKTMDYGTDENRETIVNEIAAISSGASTSSGGTAISSDDTGDEKDSLFEEAGRLIIETEKASIGMLQRKFKIGFNRAARIMDQLCEAGVVGGEEGTKPRKILMTMEQFEEIL